MISKEEVKKLATLSRIDLGDDEATKLAGEIDSILAYVGQINDAEVGTDAYVVGPHNVMREDIPSHERGEHTKDILKAAPKSENDYVVVKKIL